MVAMQQTSPSIKREIIAFPNGNRAQAVLVSPDADAAEILDALSIKQPESLITVIGVAAQIGDAKKPRLAQLFSRGIAQAAANAGALIVDGGTQAGVIEMMGQGVSDRGRRSTLLGIAPAGRITYPGGPTPDENDKKRRWPLDPNHSHFVLVESDQWDGKTELMYRLLEVLVNGQEKEPHLLRQSRPVRQLLKSRVSQTSNVSRKIPVVTMVVGGRLESGAKNEIKHSAQQGWPIIIVDGSGPLANELSKQYRKTPVELDGTAISEILTDGDIHIFSLDDQISKIEQLISSLLGRHTTLELAWRRFAVYDTESQRQQTAFEWLQGVTLALGVLATLLALVQTYFGLDYVPLHYALVGVPIIISAMTAGVNYFKSGKKWILLRAGAEAIKREIYRYRAQAERYSVRGTISAAQAKLAHKIEFISRQLMQTVVNLSALHQYEKSVPPKMYGASAEDDGLSYLTPDRYLVIRLGDQVNYYYSKAIKLERQLKLLKWTTYIIGGVGTLLAAIGLELWIALTTAFVTAFATYLEYQQVENRLVRYNQAAVDLVNLQGWWTSLSAEEKVDPKNVDKLVEHTEKILQNEHEVWVQGMQDVLADLRPEQTAEGSNAEEGMEVGSGKNLVNDEPALVED